MIVLICKYFKDEKTGKSELLVDYAMDYDTLKTVIVPCVSPYELGAKFHSDIGEYVIV